MHGCYVSSRTEATWHSQEMTAAQHTSNPLAGIWIMQTVMNLMSIYKDFVMMDL